MTIDAFTRAAVFTVQGIGPYEIPHPYASGAVLVSIIIDGAPVLLPGADYSVTPETSDARGNVYLSGAAAALHAGRALWIDRATPAVQIWEARTGEREVGLEAQLDRLTMAVQEIDAMARAAVRGRTAVEPFAPSPGCAILVRADGAGFENGPLASDIAAAQEHAEIAKASAETAVSLVTPLLALKRGTLFTSSVVDGDLDTAAKIAAINTAMADPGVRTVVFDRAYNITMPRTALVQGSVSDIFRIPAGCLIVGDPSRPITALWDTMSVSGTQKYLFAARGDEGAAVPVTSDLLVGRETVIVGASGMAALGVSKGDKVRITSDKPFIWGGTIGTEEQGEIATVTYVGDDRFAVMPPLQDTYLTADSTRVHKLSMLRGIAMEGVRAVGPGMLSSGPEMPVLGDRMLHLALCDGLRIDGAASEYFDNGSYLYSCVDGAVRDWRAVFETQNAQARNQNQYGLGLVNACQDFLVDSAYVLGGKHGVVQTKSGLYRGITRRCKIRNGTVIGTWNYGIATHTNGERWEVESNYLEGCSGGIEAGCRSMVSRNNEIRFLRYLAGYLGAGIGITEVAENILSENDRIYGGGYAVRLETSVVPLLAGSTGPKNIRVKGLYSEDQNQDALRILWSGVGVRYDVELTDISTRGIGRPVDADGLPTTGASAAASSIDVRGNASWALNRVKISGANLQGWPGNTTTCAITQYCNGVHADGISWANHAAPSIGTTNVVAANNNAF